MTNDFHYFVKVVAPRVDLITEGIDAPHPRNSGSAHLSAHRA
jgi:hypothetical protein